MTRTLRVASGSSTFQPRLISWSYRRRGSVARTQMKTRTRPSIFASIQIGSRKLGPGPIQPPRNIAAAIPETTRISMYSTSRKEPKRMPPYSVMKPWTSSASASGMSNGVRLVSAKPASMKIRKPTNWGTMNHIPPCEWTIETSESEPLIMHHAEQRQPHRDLVGDQLRGRAHRPQEAVFGARGPAAEQQPVEGDRADGEEVEDPDRDVDPVEADPVLDVAPGDDRQRQHAGEDRQQRAEDEQGRDRVLGPEGLLGDRACRRRRAAAGGRRGRRGWGRSGAGSGRSACARPPSGSAGRRRSTAKMTIDLTTMIQVASTNWVSARGSIRR